MFLECQSRFIVQLFKISCHRSARMQNIPAIVVSTCTSSRVCVCPCISLQLTPPPGRLKAWPNNQGRWKTWQATTLNPHINPSDSLKLLTSSFSVTARNSGRYWEYCPWKWSSLQYFVFFLKMMGMRWEATGQDIGWRNVFKTETEERMTKEKEAWLRLTQIQVFVQRRSEF